MSMNHEPECFAYDDTGMPYGSASPECVCEIARAAYRRVREDAARAIDNALRKAGREPQPAGADDPYSFANGFTYAGLIAIAAARGDGERA